MMPYARPVCLGSLALVLATSPSSLAGQFQWGLGAGLLDTDTNAFSFAVQGVVVVRTIGSVTISAYGAIDQNIPQKAVRDGYGKERDSEGRFLYYRNLTTGDRVPPDSAQVDPPRKRSASAYVVADWKRIRFGPGVAQNPVTRNWEGSVFLSLEATRLARIGAELPGFKGFRIRLEVFLL